VKYLHYRVFALQYPRQKTQNERNNNNKSNLCYINNSF
jgi:hypothetical protein